MSNNTKIVTGLSPRATEWVAACAGRAGQFLRVVWESEGKPTAAHRNKVLRKVTTAICRTGVQYTRIAAVRERLAAEGREAESLPWGEWAVYPLVITHRGEEYARIATAPNTRPVSTYTVDGLPVTAEEYAVLLPKRSGKTEVFTVKMRGLISIGDHTLE